MTERIPELFEVYPLKEQESFKDLPLPTNGPFYPVSEEGWYIYRNTAIGPVLLPEKKRPKLGRIGFKDGAFTWTGPKVPNHIISQAHDYFARIWKEHGTEAEVIITKHWQTEQFRLFVPWQRANGAGVKSIFEPTHIQQGWDVVGTLHSHCNFGAFHSGTDTGDASDMDGVHFTIGHVDKDEPEIAAMVMMKGTQWNFEAKDIAEVEFGTVTSPEWWDQYLFPREAPEQKPKNMPSITDEMWKEFLGRAIYKPKVETKVTKYEPKGNGWRPESKTQTEIRSWDQRKYNDMGWPEDYDWRAEIYSGFQISEESKRFNKKQAIRKAKKTGDANLDLISEVLDFAEEMGAFNDDDWKQISPKDVDDKDYWIGFFQQRKEYIDLAIAQLKGDLK